MVPRLFAKTSDPCGTVMAYSYSLKIYVGCTLRNYEGASKERERTDVRCTVRPCNWKSVVWNRSVVRQNGTIKMKHDLGGRRHASVL